MDLSNSKAVILVFGNAGKFLSCTILASEQTSQLTCELSTLYSTAQHGALYDKVQKKANTSVSTLSFRTIVPFKMVPANEQVEDDIV